MLLLACYFLCRAQFYEAGFPDKDPAYCLCAERVEISRPLPMEINARWAPEVPEEKRVFILEHPKKPNFDLEREAGHLLRGSVERERHFRRHTAAENALAPAR